MGASVSKNTAEAIASVTNSINNSTTASNANINEQTNNITASGCDITAMGDLTIKQTATVAAKNKQIAQGMSSSDLKNDIQQKMMQEAMSSVGSMGIGYADASNSASMFASSTNDVVNTVQTISSQVSSSFNNITCTDSVIRANNINITQGLSANFLNDQVAKSDNVTKIANTISQTAQQKATAKVEGLAGFIIALAVLIIASGWSFSKAASSGGILKIVIIGIVLLILGIIIGWMYISKAPPLFNDPNICSLGFSYGTGDNKCTDCINTKHQQISLDNTPMKYIFSLIGDPPKDSGLTGSLLEMIVTLKTSSEQIKINQGFNALNANNINNIAKNSYDNLPKNVKDGLPSIPPIMKINKNSSGDQLRIPDEYTPKDGGCTPQSIQINPNSSDPPSSYTPSCPSKVNQHLPPTPDDQYSVASLNTEEWQTYITKHKPQYVRFFLLRLLESSTIRFDLSTYEDENGDEPVVYMDGLDEKVDLAKNLDKSKMYKYRNHIQTAPSQFGKSGSGTITGPFGVCNNNEYKVQQFSKKFGIYIILFIVLSLGGYLLFTQLKQNKNKNKDNKKN